jgi:hypothetical protein
LFTKNNYFQTLGLSKYMILFKMEEIERDIDMVVNEQLCILEIQHKYGPYGSFFKTNMVDPKKCAKLVGKLWKWMIPYLGSRPTKLFRNGDVLLAMLSVYTNMKLLYGEDF